MPVKKFALSLAAILMLIGVPVKALAQSSTNEAIQKDLECVGAVFSYSVDRQPQLEEIFKRKFGTTIKEVGTHYIEKIIEIIGEDSARKESRIAVGNFRKTRFEQGGVEKIEALAANCVNDRSYPIMETIPGATASLPGITQAVKHDLNCISTTMSLDSLPDGKSRYEIKHNIAPAKVAAYYAARVSHALGKNAKSAITDVYKRHSDRMVIELWMLRSILLADNCAISYRAQSR